MTRKVKVLAVIGTYTLKRVGGEVPIKDIIDFNVALDASDEDIKNKIENYLLRYSPPKSKFDYKILSDEIIE